MHTTLPQAINVGHTSMPKEIFPKSVLEGSDPHVCIVHQKRSTSRNSFLWDSSDSLNHMLILNDHSTAVLESRKGSWSRPSREIWKIVDARVRIGAKF